MDFDEDGEIRVLPDALAVVRRSRRLRYWGNTEPRVRLSSVDCPIKLAAVRARKAIFVMPKSSAQRR